MRRERVESEALLGVGYDPDERLLEIEFVDGAIYRYFDIPAHLHAGLMTAGSQGAFYVENIRNAGFDFEQVR